MNQDFPPFPGGISQWAYGITNAFLEAGHSVTVYTRAKAIGDSKIHHKCRYTVIKMYGHDFNKFRMIYSSYYTIKIFLSGKFDIFIAGTWNLAFMAVFLSKFFSMKTVVVAHGWEVTREIKGIKFRELQYVFNNSTTNIAVSHFTRQHIIVKLNISEDRIKVLPNGVDLKRFHKINDFQDIQKRWQLDGKKIVLTLARIVERKGHDIVIKAMPKVISKVPGAIYMIAGNGSNKIITDLHRLIHQLKLEDHVIFIGYVNDEDLIKYYNLCDVYIMVSRVLEDEGDIEGFGISYLEANACEKPVIGGNSGGIPDAIVDGKTGFLVNPYDENEVADTIIMLLTNPDLAQEIGKTGFHRIKQELTWQRIVEKLLPMVLDKDIL